MATFITMPKLGLTMTKGTVTMWLKREGDEVRAEEAVCEIETDKITESVRSPADGVLIKIIAAEYEEREIAAPLCVLGAKGEAWDGEFPSATPSAVEGSTAETSVFPTAAVDQQEKRLVVSPVARRLAEEKSVDLTTLTGTGPDDRIEKKDVEAWLAITAKLEASATQTVEAGAGPRVGKRIPLSGPRKIAAERLAASKRDAPHVYFKIAVDATAALGVKRQAADAAGSGRKPTLNDVIVKAVAGALVDFPEVNAMFVGSEIICFSDINIGIAVDSDKGLYVTVLRSADRKSLQEIADASGLLISRAREGRPAPDDLAGGTFTISNLGTYGMDEFSAVINPPQTAILAVGKAKDMPVVVNGGIFVRPMMNLTLSVDHRAIDGSMAARFLAKLKSILEAPCQL